MQKKRAAAPPKEPHELPDNQRYLYACIGTAMKHANRKHPLTFADYLRVLEAYREAFTEQWMRDEPELIPHINKILKDLN